MDYYVRNIQALLMEGFSKAELQEFVDYDPIFRTIRNYIPARASKAEIVEVLIKHAGQKQEYSRLLEWAEMKNPKRYEYDRPYELRDMIGVLDSAFTVFTFSPEIKPTLQDREDDFAWEMTALKSELHALSETVAQEAAKQVPLEESNALYLLIPLLFFLRWKRGYKAGLEYILGLDERKIYLEEFHLVETDPPCQVEYGILSAELSNDQQILIKLDDHPAAFVESSDLADIPAILNSINAYGRLSRYQNVTEKVPLIEMLARIPIYPHLADEDELTLTLIRNRQVLLPLLARLGIPGSDWFLGGEEGQSAIGKSLLKNTLARKSSHTTERSSIAEGGEDIEQIPFHLQGRLYQPFVQYIEETLQRYTHVSKQALGWVRSPLDSDTLDDTEMDA